VVFAQGKGVAWEKDRTFNAKQGVPVRDLEAWMKDNLVPNSRGLLTTSNV
jgi:hypothetical protein